MLLALSDVDLYHVLLSKQEGYRVVGSLFFVAFLAFLNEKIKTIRRVWIFIIQERSCFSFLMCFFSLSLGEQHIKNSVCLQKQNINLFL